MKKVVTFLTGLPMTIVGGVFLLASLVLQICRVDTPFDPAWVAVLICGLPILYSALSGLFLHGKISSSLLITIAMAACISVGELFAAGEVAFIMALGELLEDFMVRRARRKIMGKAESTDSEESETTIPMQRIVDRWATWLVPIALLIAVVTWLATGDLVRGVTVLVVFCPCALVLATPVSVAAGIGQATKSGILIKSGEALERMGKVDCVALDEAAHLPEKVAAELSKMNVKTEKLIEPKENVTAQLLQDGKVVCTIGGAAGADIVLAGNDISKIPYIKRLSNAVIRSIKVNIAIAMTINFIAIALSVLGLLGPVLGALIHNCGTVIVILNAALLYDRRI